MAQVLLSGFMDEGVPGKSAEGQLAICRALGLSWYTIRFIDLGGGVKNALDLTPDELAKLKKLHAEYGVRVSSLGSPLGKIKLKDVEDGTKNAYVPPGKYLDGAVRRAVDLAGELGTKLIRGFSFYPPKGDDPYQHLEEAADRIGEIVRVCAEGGVYYGLEVEANLVGRDGETLAALHQKVAHPNLFLVFDGGNLVCQGRTTDEVFGEYQAMKAGLGWMHVKDYARTPEVEWKGYVDEEMLKHFVPADRGDVGHERIFRDFKGVLPALTERLAKLGIPGVFLDLEPHLKGGGQFGGFSGPDGLGVALRALTRVLDYAGIGYSLTGYEDLGG